MLHHHFVHVDNELVEFVPASEQEYEEIIDEYEGGDSRTGGSPRAISC